MSNKRKSNAEGTEANIAHDSPRRAPRQDPVSCQTCRAKKLKCDRLQLCSNCRARRVACIYGFDQGVHTRNAAHNDFAKVSRPPVFNVSENKSGFPEVTSTSMLEAGTRSRENSEEQLTADWLEKIVMGQRIPDALPATLKNKLLAINSIPPTELASFLPRESETLALFNYYVSYVDYISSIIIPSRVKSQIDAIYRNLRSQRSADLNHMALLFSILAAASYFQEHDPVEVPKRAEARCREYTSLVGAALIQSNYMNYPTLEGLQATMIVAQMLPNLDQDASVRAFFVHGTIVSQGRHMGLHRIDCSRNCENRQLNGFDLVELETKRRLWWNLAAHDWYEPNNPLLLIAADTSKRLLGFLSGPQEGTYFISPKQMSVQMFSNMEDDDIGKAENGHSMAENVPSRMSYSIQRLKLACVCREIVDKIGLGHINGIDGDYEVILELDQKLNEAYKELPDFFKVDAGNRRKYAPLYRRRPQLLWQRLLVQQGYHSRFCQLHRGYFIRGARDPPFSYSYMVCLRSARRVLELKRVMDDDDMFLPNSSTVWSIIHHVFLAAVVLLMDICFNWDDILAEKRREEVLQACRMLDQAQLRSKIVREGINAMMEILQRHWQRATSEQSNIVLENGNSAAGSPPLGINAANKPVKVSCKAQTAVINNGDSQGLENMWSEFIDSSATVGGSSDEWMGLLTDLTDLVPPLE
jgi:hypothetical protein